MTTENCTLNAIIIRLNDVAGRIRSLESEAHEALYVSNDPGIHKMKLLEKASLLQEILEGVMDCLAELPAPLATLLQDRLGGMAFSAGKAIQLDSVFYMSALLYPEEYVEGEANDLESFIHSLEEWR